MGEVTKTCYENEEEGERANGHHYRNNNKRNKVEVRKWTEKRDSRYK